MRVTYECSISFPYVAKSPEDAAAMFIGQLRVPGADWLIDVHQIYNGKKFLVDTETWEVEAETAPVAVVIEVSGGVASVESCPDGVEVRIIDKDVGEPDCEECGEPMDTHNNLECPSWTRR
jgi:hypothetical protein